MLARKGESGSVFEIPLEFQREFFVGKCAEPFQDKWSLGTRVFCLTLVMFHEALLHILGGADVETLIHLAFQDVHEMHNKDYKQTTAWKGGCLLQCRVCTAKLVAICEEVIPSCFA